MREGGGENVMGTSSGISFSFGDLGDPETLRQLTFYWIYLCVTQDSLM